MDKVTILNAVEQRRIATTRSEVDRADRMILEAVEDAFDKSPLEKDILKLRQKYAPIIFASLLGQSHQGNDDRAVARAVSLAHKLAVIVLQS